MYNTDRVLRVNSQKMPLANDNKLIIWVETYCHLHFLAWEAPYPHQSIGSEAEEVEAESVEVLAALLVVAAAFYDVEQRLCTVLLVATTDKINVCSWAYELWYRKYK